MITHGVRFDAAFEQAFAAEHNGLAPPSYHAKLEFCVRQLAEENRRLRADLAKLRNTLSRL